MKSLYLNAGLENLLEHLLYAKEDQGGYHEDVRKVEGEPPEGLVGAVGLDKVDVIARVRGDVHPRSALLRLQTIQSIDSLWDSNVITIPERTGCNRAGFH